MQAKACVVERYCCPEAFHDILHVQHIHHLWSPLIQVCFDELSSDLSHNTSEWPYNTRI
ncbi:hypothetical protein KDH_39720 [Dictyobacter sp. S3.2.2.5]|uniref:Uncharacterized protein n=1 Tax=Dictyobacter halimunensis TaxID=3026934 RepID=A0ABQ6FU79_9CHLR|nr:hypothetical protein KDH_39720 [Dictyobacter sp. S3.2.2.5]